MEKNQSKRRIYNKEKIPINSTSFKKNKSQILNNNMDKFNSKRVNKYINNKDKKFIAKHNSNYKLADNNNVGINNTKYSFIQNLRNKYNIMNYNNIKNLSSNEVFSNKSFIESKQKTTINKNNKNKNLSLNKTNISSTNKKTKDLSRITFSLEKKINTYLIPKPVTSNHFKNKNMKFVEAGKITNYTKNKKLIDSNSSQKPHSTQILSKYYELNKYQKIDSNYKDDNNNEINSSKIKQTKNELIKEENEMDNNDLKNNFYYNLNVSNKDYMKKMFKKYSENNNKHAYENDILDKKDEINSTNKYLLQSNKSEDNFIENRYYINNGITKNNKKLENLITKNIKEEEEDINISKKINNIIQNLRNDKKKKVNKFININNQTTKEILNLESKEKKDKEKFLNVNNTDNFLHLQENKNNYTNKNIKREKNQENIFENKSETRNNDDNKKINNLNGNQKQIYEKEKINKILDTISLNKEKTDLYNFNKNSEVNIITNSCPNNNENSNLNINQSINNNSNLLENNNSKILLPKTIVNYKNSCLNNNRYQNIDIKKINIENIKNKYSIKKELNKINEKFTIPQLITKSLTGLVNLGETCYMNAGLQNLIHCIPFINQLFDLLNGSKELFEQKLISNSFINLCLSLIKIDNYNLKYNLNSYDPISFRNSFCRNHIQYSDHEQHDSLEFIRILLDDISKELNQTKIISKYKELSTEGKTKEQQNLEYNEFYLCRENSIIVKVFYSQIMNIFVCQCGDTSYSFEKILDIPLLFPKETNEKEINLDDLILNYFEGEDISWNLPCQKCGKKDLSRNKKIKITILPSVLIFSLQRFNPATGVKINKYINFNEVIDLKQFCDNDFFNGKLNAQYKLFGISNHSGTINFGHYYSYTRVGNNWFEFNDSFVKLINLTFFSKSAYFFFYEKIDL